MKVPGKPPSALGALAGLASLAVILLALSSALDPGDNDAIAPRLEPYAEQFDTPAPAYGAPSYGAEGELIVYADASLRKPIEELSGLYAGTVRCRFASAQTLLAALDQGAACDLFLCAAPELLDDLEARDQITDRIVLGENRMVLAVPEGNPRDLHSFSLLADWVRQGRVRVAVGQGTEEACARKILAYYGASDCDRALIRCSKGTEAAVRLEEGMADCAVLFATDAGGLLTVDTASPGMSGRILSTAAALSRSKHPVQAQGFLDFLSGPEAAAVFQRRGFLPQPAAVQDPPAQEPPLENPEGSPEEPPEAETPV